MRKLLLLGLLAAQVTLGVLTVLLKKPADVASAHVAVGALLLLTTFVLLVRSMRIYSQAGALARGFETVERPESREGGFTGASRRPVVS